MLAGKDPVGFEPAHGLGSDDNPVFHDMHRAASHVVGATVEAFRQVWSGESLHSANITGGLHHAMPDRASGFCIYNDLAVGIRWLLDNGATKVAYVDVDVHHGDGVEKIFYDDPRVLTISLHETGQTLFPGTGFPQDVGGPDARGSAVNVALPPGTSDAGWLRAFHAVVPRAAPRVRAGRPGHPARLRQPPRRPARRPDAERRRPARVVPRAARPGPRGLRRQVDRHRRGRLRPGRGGPARVEPPAVGGRRPPARRLDADARRVARVRPRAPRPVGAAPASPTAATPPTATGRRATTPPPGWTGPSTRPGRRSSRSTASTRSPDRRFRGPAR